MELKPLKKNPNEIIKIVIDKLKEQFGKKLLYVGGKGSLANNNFTEYSDLDLIVAIEDNKFKIEYKTFIYNTTVIDIQISSYKSIKEDLETIDFYWPIKLGGILNLKIYYGDKKYLEELNSSYLKLKKNKVLFENAISLDSITEYYSKAKRAYANKELEELNWHSMELWEMFAFIIALLNQNYYINQGPKKFINQINNFKYKPEGWKEAFELVISNNYDNMIKGCKMIFDISYELSKKHKFRNLNIKKISEISFK